MPSLDRISETVSGLLRQPLSCFFPLSAFMGHPCVQDNVISAASTTQRACLSSLGAAFDESPQLSDF